MPRQGQTRRFKHFLLGFVYASGGGERAQGLNHTWSRQQVCINCERLSIGRCDVEMELSPGGPAQNKAIFSHQYSHGARRTFHKLDGTMSVWRLSPPLLPWRAAIAGERSGVWRSGCVRTPTAALAAAAPSPAFLIAAAAIAGTDAATRAEEVDARAVRPLTSALFGRGISAAQRRKLCVALMQGVNSSSSH